MIRVRLDFRGRKPLQGRAKAIGRWIRTQSISIGNGVDGRLLSERGVFVSVIEGQGRVRESCRDTEDMARNIWES